MPVALLAIVRAHWKAVGALLLFSGLVVALLLSRASTARFRALYGQSQAQRAADAASYRAAQAEAARIATKAKADREAAFAQAQEDSTNAYQAQLADARARLAAYARLHAAPGADPGRAGKPDLPRASERAGLADGPGPDALMVSADDAAICTENSVRLVNIREWWASVQDKP